VQLSSIHARLAYLDAPEEPARSKPTGDAARTSVSVQPPLSLRPRPQEIEGAALHAPRRPSNLGAASLAAAGPAAAAPSPRGLPGSRGPGEAAGPALDSGTVWLPEAESALAPLPRKSEDPWLSRRGMRAPPPPGAPRADVGGAFDSPVFDAPWPRTAPIAPPMADEAPRPASPPREEPARPASPRRARPAAAAPRPHEAPHQSAGAGEGVLAPPSYERCVAALARLAARRPHPLDVATAFTQKARPAPRPTRAGAGPWPHAAW